MVTCLDPSSILGDSTREDNFNFVENCPLFSCKSNLSENYLLDPHGAVSLIAADSHKEALGNLKLICLATAHPAKFPEVIKQSLNRNDLPSQASHHSLEKAKSKCEKVYLCDHSHLEEALTNIMESNWDLNH